MNTSRVPALLIPTQGPTRAGLTNIGRPSFDATASNDGASPRLENPEDTRLAGRRRASAAWRHLCPSPPPSGGAEPMRDTSDLGEALDRSHLRPKGHVKTRKRRRAARETSAAAPSASGRVASRPGASQMSAMGGSDWRERRPGTCRPELSAGSQVPDRVNSDRDDLVARRIECAETRSQQQNGHVVLGRAAAEQQRDPKSLGRQ